MRSLTTDELKGPNLHLCTNLVLSQPDTTVLYVNIIQQLFSFLHFRWAKINNIIILRKVFVNTLNQVILNKALVVAMLILCMDIQNPIEFVSATHVLPPHEWVYSEDNDFNILLGADGTVFVTDVNSRDSYTLVQGHSLLLLPGQVYNCYRPSKKEASFYRIQFRCKNVSQSLISTDPNINTLFSERDRLTNLVIVPDLFKFTNLPRICIIVHQLLHVANSNYYTKQSLNYLLTSLLIEMSEQVVRQSMQETQRRQSGQIYKIASWIKANIEKPLTLDNIATEFGYNKNYLTRWFRQELGVPVQKYINICKIDKAKELLYSSNLSNKEIAYQLGFTDDKYLMRMFKQYEGITMQEFRKAYDLTHHANL